MVAVYKDISTNAQPSGGTAGYAHVRARRRAPAAVPLPMSHEMSWDIRLMQWTTRLLMLIALLLLLTLALHWLANRGVFSVDRLRLEGDLQHINPESVRAQAKARLSGSFFTLNLASAKQAFEQLPWVRQAMVRRTWPHGMAVMIESHKPVALWLSLPDSGMSTQSGDERLLNDHAEIFEANIDELDEDLPHLSGPPSRAARVWQMYGQLNEALKAASTGNRVSALLLTPRSEWEVELDDGMTLSLGRDDERLWERVARYSATIEQVRSQLNTLGQRSALAHVDLRHTQGYAIGLHKADDATNRVTMQENEDTITSMSKDAGHNNHINAGSVATAQGQ